MKIQCQDVKKKTGTYDCAFLLPLALPPDLPPVILEKRLIQKGFGSFRVRWLFGGAKVMKEALRTDTERVGDKK